MKPYTSDWFVAETPAAPRITRINETILSVHISAYFRIWVHFISKTHAIF